MKLQRSLWGQKLYPVGVLKSLRQLIKKKMMGHFDVKHLHRSKSPFVSPYSEDDQYQNETS